MQKARRRLMYSTASVSSPSNTSLNTRKRSRTASAGGDCVTVGENSNIFRNGSASKVRPRSTKYNMRLLPGKIKSSKKVTKANKSVRPTFKSLQNSIVLAPFYTLKKCFQSKLVDLYSHEKIKKQDHQEKMAKKQNLSFEYDVFELNSLKQKKMKVKKLENETKTAKKKTSQNEKKAKPRRSDSVKSGSYCQCEKNEPDTENEKYKKSVINVFNNNKLTTKATNSQTQGPSGKTKLRQPSFLVEGSSKRRKLDSKILNASTLEENFEKEFALLNSNADNLGEGIKSDTISSLADVSSVSNIDSWETYSDSPSFREEHLEGSLAISTTSFDSCFEQHDKEKISKNCAPQSKRSYLKSKSRSNLQNQKGKKNARKTQKSSKKSSYFFDLALDFPPKPKPNQSSHLIMNVRTKKSDGIITDFTDREPQEQKLSSLETSQHLQPLRIKSKSKMKKPRKENENVKQYYLRSAESSERGNSINGDDVILGSVENSFEQNSSSKRGRNNEQSSRKELKRNINLTHNMETQGTSEAVQNEEREYISPTTSANILNQKHLVTENKCENEIFNISSVEDSNTNSEGNLPDKLDDFEKTKDLEMIDNSEPDGTENVNKTEENLNVAKSRETSVGSKDEGELHSKPASNSKLNREVEETNNGSININNEENFEEIIDPSEGENIEIHQPSLQIEHLNDGEELQRSTSGIRQISQTLDADFIFGAKNTSVELGDSCKFSFGLNRNYSDDEDSDNRDLFF